MFGDLNMGAAQVRRKGESQVALEIDGAALAEGCALLVKTKATLDFATAWQLIHCLATLRYICCPHCHNVSSIENTKENLRRQADSREAHG